MRKQKLLGQHFLNSEHIAKKIISSANITKNDTVFEIGTGHGILTILLCKIAHKVISIDADEQLVNNARIAMSHLDNLTLLYGDGFEQKCTFSVFVSNIPYSKSKDAIEWLAQMTFSHGVIMVQKEFAEKLIAKPYNRRAIGVIATHCFEIETILNVNKNNFVPPPQVDSVVLKITQKTTLDKKTIQTIHKIFSYKRKTIKNILKQFGIQSSNEKRLDELTGDELVKLARNIQR